MYVHPKGGQKHKIIITTAGKRSFPVPFFFAETPFFDHFRLKESIFSHKTTTRYPVPLGGAFWAFYMAFLASCPWANFAVLYLRLGAYLGEMSLGHFLRV